MTKKIKHLTIALLWAGGLSSCSDKMDNNDPKKAILGKWELVASHHEAYPAPEPVKPTHYFEFREDGVVVWYDYATGKYNEMRYWIEQTEYNPSFRHPVYKNKKWWHLYLQFEPNRNNVSHSFYLTFFSENRIGLVSAFILSQFTIVDIYERKK